jgi:sigma-B regulation protein RsbQ
MEHMTHMTALHRNNVKILGSGDQTIMFAHGYGCDQSMWRHVYPSFLDNYKVVLFDYVGSGSSDVTAFNTARYSSLRGYALDILDIIEELSLKEVNFVGHSVSSMIGALASIESPDRFRTLTMIGPSPCYINSGDYEGGWSVPMSTACSRPWRVIMLRGPRRWPRPLWETLKRPN